MFSVPFHSIVKKKRLLICGWKFISQFFCALLFDSEMANKEKKLLSFAVSWSVAGVCLSFYEKINRLLIHWLALLIQLSIYLLLPCCLIQIFNCLQEVIYYWKVCESLLSRKYMDYFCKSIFLGNRVLQVCYNRLYRKKLVEKRRESLRGW